MIFIVTTFSIVITFFDFQLVYVLTGGGPANSTHLMATYAYSLSMGAGQMGLGSAVALSMVPVLGLLLVLLTAVRAQGLSPDGRRADLAEAALRSLAAAARRSS